MCTITPSIFDPSNGEHIQYVMDNADAYTEEELTSIYNILDVDIKKRSYAHFLTYNIMDVQLVCELNDKLRHLDLCTQIAYDARVNYIDTFKQVRLWDAMMYYELHEKQIAIPTKVFHDKGEKFSGGYVKVPILGKHEWVVSFDVNSLYPSIMRQWNISPDRHLPIELLESRLDDIQHIRGAMREYTPNLEDCTPREWLDNVREQDAPIVRWALRETIQYLRSTNIEQALSDLQMPSPVFPWLKVLSICITPNKQAFRADSPGFLPVMLSRLYQERKRAKDKETQAKKLAETATNPEERRKHENDAIQWGLQQSTRKINLNSCYGAFGNEFFRFFDVRQAEAVTMTGQMIIRHVADRVNNFLNSEFGTSKDYVLASDTDSIYISLAPAVQNMQGAAAAEFLDQYCEQTIQPIIDAAFAKIGSEFHTQDNILAMKREAIAETGVWVAKKRYLLLVHNNEGVRYHPAKLKMVGVQAVQSSTPKYARDVIKKSLDYFIRGNKQEFYALLDEAEQQFLTRPFTDIASPRSCNGLDVVYRIEPSGEFTPKTPFHVKGALVYNKHLDDTGMADRYAKIQNGEKIRFCYLKTRNPLRVNVIAAPNTLPSEWKLEPYLDRQEQFEKTVLSPIEDIITHANWSTRPIVTLDF